MARAAAAAAAAGEAISCAGDLGSGLWFGWLRCRRRGDDAASGGGSEGGPGGRERAALRAAAAQGRGEGERTGDAGRVATRRPTGRPSGRRCGLPFPGERGRRRPGRSDRAVGELMRPRCRRGPARSPRGWSEGTAAVCRPSGGGDGRAAGLLCVETLTRPIRRGGWEFKCGALRLYLSTLSVPSADRGADLAASRRCASPGEHGGPGGVDFACGLQITRTRRRPPGGGDGPYPSTKRRRPPRGSPSETRRRRRRRSATRRRRRR